MTEEKPWHTTDYERLIALLRQRRKKAGVTQYDVAEHLGQTQSFVSKIERGELRLDVLQTKLYCQAVGCSFLGLIREWDTDGQ